jgi:serine/threonine protein kinase
MVEPCDEKLKQTMLESGPRGLPLVDTDIRYGSLLQRLRVADVRRVRDRDDLVVKVISPETFGNDLSVVRNELQHLRATSRLRCAVHASAFAVEDSEIVLLFPRLDMSLQKYLEKRSDFPFANRLRLCYLITEALVELHDCRLAHLDLKPNNIFLDLNEDGVQGVKFMDIGLGRFVWPRLQETTHALDTALEYSFRAPEQVVACQLQGSVSGSIHLRRHLSRRTDMFALGLLMVQIFSVDYTRWWRGNSIAAREDEISAVTSGVRHPSALLEVSTVCPPFVIQALFHLLQRDWRDRWTARELLNFLRDHTAADRTAVAASLLSTALPRPSDVDSASGAVQACAVESQSDSVACRAPVITDSLKRAEPLDSVARFAGSTLCVAGAFTHVVSCAERVFLFSLSRGFGWAQVGAPQDGILFAVDVPLPSGAGKSDDETVLATDEELDAWE